MPESELLPRDTPVKVKRKRIQSANDSIDGSSSSSDSTLPPPPDGGWGWLIVLAAFLIHLIADGVTFSFGIFFVNLQEQYHEGKGKTAWIGSLFIGVPLLAGPIASALTDQYGCRRVTIAGAILAASGFIISTFANSIELLCLTFGFISGIGLALVYVTAIVAVAYYFEKRRSFATGLAVCGSGIGTFIFAPLTEELLNEYNFRGTLLILAGFFLNMIVCGALMRELEWPNSVERKREKVMRSLEKFSIQHNSHHSLDEKSKFGNGSVPNDYASIRDRLSTSLVELPTYVKNGHISPIIFDTLRKKGSNLEFVSQYTPALLGLDYTPDESLTTIANHVNEPEKLNALPSSHQIKDIWLKRRSSSKPKKQVRVRQLQRLRLNRHNLTYRGCMLNFPRYTIKASSCPDLYKNSLNSDDEDEEDTLTVFCQHIQKMIKNMMDLSPFKNVMFLLFCISNLALYMWYDIPYIYLTDRAQLHHISKDKASYLISIIGIVNTIGQVIYGYVGDKPWCNTLMLYSVSVVMCGVSTLAVPLITDYISLCIYSGVFGFFISANYSLTSIIVVDLISLENFTSAYGLLLLVQGIATLVGPPFAGWLYDLTGNYDSSFYMSGVWIVVSGLIVLPLPFINSLKRTRTKDSFVESTLTTMESQVVNCERLIVTEIETVL